MKACAIETMQWSDGKFDCSQDLMLASLHIFSFSFGAHSASLLLCYRLIDLHQLPKSRFLFFFPRLLVGAGKLVQLGREVYAWDVDHPRFRIL